jgi:predicted metal-dependent hydrolase
VSQGFIPVIRIPGLDFSGSNIPKNWSGNAYQSLMGNAVNLLFPDGERYFVRSVRAFASEIKDPVLLEQMKGFYGQEGRHAVEHERHFELLKSQGYDLDRFRRWMDRIGFQLIEPLTSKSLRLAVTAGAEHFTALMGEHGLTTNDLEDAHPVMRELLAWHAVEELEHKSVAFDVYQAVDGRYWLRIAGFGMASALLGGFWLLAAADLYAQSSKEERAQIWKDRAKLKASKKGLANPVFLKGLREYFRRDFHPNQNNTDGLLKKFFESSKLAAPKPVVAMVELEAA